MGLGYPARLDSVRVRSEAAAGGQMNEQMLCNLNESFRHTLERTATWSVCPGLTFRRADLNPCRRCRCDQVIKIVGYHGLRWTRRIAHDRLTRPRPSHDLASERSPRLLKDASLSARGGRSVRSKRSERSERSPPAPPLLKPAVRSPLNLSPKGLRPNPPLLKPSPPLPPPLLPPP